MPRLHIGIDEVGRGSLAGPVVLAAIIRVGPVRWTHPLLGRIRDSKKLSPQKRLLWRNHLLGHPGLIAKLVSIGPRTIDAVNISQAANLGARRLVKKASLHSNNLFVWLDGGLALPSAIPHRVVIRGDESIPLIAAASIIAKVWRDHFMEQLGRRFPEYGFEIHKGYATRLHRERLLIHGPSPVHRVSFLGWLRRTSHHFSTPPLS